MSVRDEARDKLR